RAEDGIRGFLVTGVQTCALPICVEYLSQAADAVANLNEEKRQLIAVIGTGTLGAVGAFAGLTTAVWGASRAMQGLASVFRLASGPAGWIALTGSAIFSLTAGFMAAQTAMRAAREEIIRFGSLGDVEREIEKVTAEIEALETQLERLRTPQIGGPSIRFTTEEEIQKLHDDLERLIARREELIRLEREQKQFLDQLNEAMISASATTRSLSDILADHAKRLENVRILSELLGDSFDLADEQIRAFERTIVDAVESGHAHAQAILEFAEAYREMVEAAKLAQQETSRMIMPLSDLARWVEIIDLRRRMGMTLPTRPDHFLGDLPQDIEWQAWRMLSDIAGELREEFERLTAEGKGFSEAALDILRLLERVTREIEELEAKLRRQEPIPVTPPLPAPMAAPTMTRDEARMAEFVERAREDLRRLAEQVQAGLMPTQEAIRLLFQWRAQMISLAGPLGGLINLNTEQL